jgi:hypothetical protein
LKSSLEYRGLKSEVTHSGSCSAVNGDISGDESEVTLSGSCSAVNGDIIGDESEVTHSGSCSAVNGDISGDESMSQLVSQRNVFLSPIQYA